MWKGDVGFDFQLIYTTHNLTGTFDDPLSGQLTFDYKVSQFDFPIMLKVAWPTRYITPTISFGKMWRKGTDINRKLTGGVADSRLPFGYVQEHWLTRFGGGIETKLPFENHDIRLSLNIIVNYDGQIADGLKGDEHDSICYDVDEGNETIRICQLDPQLGVVWRTDVMIGVGYHF